MDLINFYFTILNLQTDSIKSLIFLTDSSWVEMINLLNITKSFINIEWNLSFKPYSMNELQLNQSYSHLGTN